MRIATPMARMSRSPGRAFVIIFLLSFAVRGLLLASRMIGPQLVTPEIRPSWNE
ncbi:MAG: hypothetical protein M1337_07155 [Actinobacteria bacterium]|nr:hypothetical protein [Actinomycetota bacterium]